MSRRNYNVFFNMHTVSGIVISVALYVIFFAGAFALFKEQISIWEEGNFVSHTKNQNINFDTILNNLDETYELTGRDIRFLFQDKTDDLGILLSSSKDTLASKKAKESSFFYVDILSGVTKTYSEKYSLGEFLYRLHFFAQIPTFGAYLAGFVALFFLFAIVTGVIVHWKKIISNFYTFNPRIALKRVWTDAHTVLGVIGLPFQFIFAVTGAYLALTILVLIPANTLYNNNQAKLMEDLSPDRKNYEWISSAQEGFPSFNAFAKKTATRWKNFHLTRGYIKNYGGIHMKYILVGTLSDQERFVSTGRVVLDAYTGNIDTIKTPYTGDYIQDVQNVVRRLHFADFGGIPLKIVYFILALATCFVIITGVLIWIEARSKKNRPLKQRLYTAKIGHIYLAISLSMLPVTALAFLFAKLSQGYFEDKQTTFYWFYFVTWLIAIVFFRFKRDNYFTNKYCLLSGAILGFLIPIVNGMVSGNWIWYTYSQHQFDILLIDVLWLVIATCSFLFYLKLAPKDHMKSTFVTSPIDYKNLSAIKSEV